LSSISTSDDRRDHNIAMLHFFEARDIVRLPLICACRRRRLVDIQG
jgi:hypothetical protein